MGTNDTFGDQISLSALYGPFSISLGQLHYQTDGFRENNDLTRDAYDLFAQVLLGPSTSILAELRYEDVEQGDLPLRFDPDNFNPDLRQEEKTRSARLGLRHAFAPGSELIATAAYLDAEFPARNVAPEFDLDADVEGWIGEIQYAFQRARIRLVSGLGYFDATRENSQRDASVDPPLATSSTEDIHHANGYVYTLLNWPDPVTWTLGVSVDLFDTTAPGSSRDQVNPKVGVMWTPMPDTTLRAAFFRTLKRQLVSNQTIEPTQVAGFNQFYDDIDGTDAWRAGVGIDQKLGSRAAVGGEFSARELTFPFTDLTDITAPVNDRATWREQFARAYAYWAPFSWLALSAEYFYEYFDRESAFPGPDLFTELRTHRIPLGVSFFHPLGITARFRVTYVNQEGRFENLVEGGTTRGQDQFWVADASTLLPASEAPRAHHPRGPESPRRGLPLPGHGPREPAGHPGAVRAAEVHPGLLTTPQKETDRHADARSATWDRAGAPRRARPPRHRVRHHLPTPPPPGPRGLRPEPGHARGNRHRHRSDRHAHRRHLAADSGGESDHDQAGGSHQARGHRKVLAEKTFLAPGIQTLTIFGMGDPCQYIIQGGRAIKRCW